MRIRCGGLISAARSNRLLLHNLFNLRNCVNALQNVYESPVSAEPGTIHPALVITSRYGTKAEVCREPAAHYKETFTSALQRCGP